MKFFDISLVHYLVLACIVFITALCGIFIAKNLIRILILVEILFCAVCINFIAFANYFDSNLTGMIFALFIVGVSVSQLAVGITLVFSLYKKEKNIDTDTVREIGG